MRSSNKRARRVCELALAVVLAVPLYGVSGTSSAYAAGNSPTANTLQTSQEFHPSTLQTSKKKSSKAKFTRKAPKLKTPVNTAVGIEVRWSKKKGAKGYKLYKLAPGAKSYKRIKTIKSSKATSYVDKKVTATQAYCYKLKAYNSKHHLSKAATTKAFVFYHCYSGTRWYALGKEIPKQDYIIVCTSAENGYVCLASAADTADIVVQTNVPGIIFYRSESILPGCNYLQLYNAKLYLASEVGCASNVTSITNSQGYIKYGTYRGGVDLPAGTYLLQTAYGNETWGDWQPAYYALCRIWTMDISKCLDNGVIFDQGTTKQITIQNGQYVQFSWGLLKRIS
jgi:hypothetical protein